MIARTTNVLPEYIYMPLPDGKADVFINKYISEDEDGFEYETYEFRTDKLTEKDISANPFSFIGYAEKEKTQEDRISELEMIIEEQNDALIELADIISEVMA